jgi:hypothetical protein
MDQLPDGTKYVRAISPIKIPLKADNKPKAKSPKMKGRASEDTLGVHKIRSTHPPTWPDSATLKKLLETHTTATYNAQNLPASVAATDCTSLYDLITRTTAPSCTEYRTQLNARARLRNFSPCGGFIVVLN